MVSLLILLHLLDEITLQLRDHLETVIVWCKCENKNNNAFHTCFKKKNPDFATQELYQSSIYNIVGKISWFHWNFSCCSSDMNLSESRTLSVTQQLLI